MNGEHKLNAQPAEVLTIDSVEVLRILADPLRMRLMNIVMDAKGTPITVKQLATQLDVRPTRLYYHVNLLEEHGLLRVASSRVVSGIIEKSYVAPARSIGFDPKLLAGNPAGRDAAAASLTALLQATAVELAESLEISAANQADAELRQIRVGKHSAHLTPEAHAEFDRRLAELVAEFEEKYASTEADLPSRALFVAYYPIAGGKNE